MPVAPAPRPPPTSAVAIPIAAAGAATPLPLPAVGAGAADPQIDQHEYSELLGVIKACRQDADRFMRLKPLLGTSRFSVDQVKQLVALFTMGDKKVEAAIILYPR